MKKKDRLNLVMQGRPNVSLPTTKISLTGKNHHNLWSRAWPQVSWIWLMLSGTFHTLVSDTEKLAAIFSNPEIKRNMWKIRRKW